MNIGNMLKEVRTYDLVTQKEIAKVMGISEKTYGIYEKQYKIIPMKHLITFCEYFRVSLDYIFELSKGRNIKNKLSLHKFGYHLKQFRTNENITQEQLAEIMKFNRSLITKYEKNARLVSTPFLYTFCHKYHISADSLLK